MSPKTSALLARLLDRLTEQESQRVQQASAQAAAAAALVTDPKKRRALSKVADYLGHEGDALAHAERVLKAKRKRRK